MVAASVLILGACSENVCIDGNCWASQDQIVEAAARCGISDFKPTKAGVTWAAYVDETVPDASKKEECIYADLKAQNFLVTR